MAALARSRSAVRYDFKGQPDDSTAWPNTFPARGRSTRKSWLIGGSQKACIGELFKRIARRPFGGLEHDLRVAAV